VCAVGAQDTDDGAHDDGEYGSEEPLREQVTQNLLDFGINRILNSK